MTNKKYPILIRDDKFFVTIFFVMMFNIFLIFGPVSLVVKEASFSIFLWFFFMGATLLYVKKATDKTKPRFIVFEDDAAKLIFWDSHQEIYPLKEIKEVEVKGRLFKTFNGTITFLLEDKKIVINVEVLKTVVETVRNLTNKVKISYVGDSIEESIAYNLNPNRLRSFFYQGVLWFFVFTFFAMGIGMNYCLLAHKI